MEDVLETERLRLRAPRPEDAEAIAAQIGDWDVAKMLARVPHPYSLSDARDWLSTVTDPAQRAPNLIFVVEAQNKLIGNVTIGEVRNIEGAPIGVLGYWFGKSHWNKGYASEATRVLVQHAFVAQRFAGLTSGHFKVNGASGRVLAKLGFRYAGEGTKYCLARNAQTPHVDVVLTRAQWQDFVGGKVA